MSSDLSELEKLQQRIEELEGIAREYTELKQLIEAAANNQNLDEYGSRAFLTVDQATQQIVDANPKATALLGFSTQELCSLHIHDLEMMPDADKTRRSVTTYVQNASEEQIYLCSFRHHDGHPVPVRVYHRLLQTKGTNPLFQYTLEETSLRHKLWTELNRREDQGFEFREKLTSLNEINLQLAEAQSFDELCRMAIELGMEKLGFDRLSIWFRDENAQLMIGTYGVDETGTIRDEHNIQWSYAGTYVVDFMEGKNDSFVIHDKAPIYNHLSQVIGYGWHIAVPLMDSGQPIGFMTADNFINQFPMKEYEPDLLRLYGITIGHLAAHQQEQDTIRKLSNAIQQSDSMIAVLNEQAVVEFVNHTFTHISGYRREDIVGKPLTLLVPREEYPEVWQAITNGHSWHGELVQHNRSGKGYETLTSISPIFTHDRTHSFVVVQEDITELKETRKHQFDLQLEQERNRMLKTFIGDIGHEFRNPLSVISLKNYLLQKVDDGAQRAVLVEEVQEQVRVISSMIDNLNYIVKLESESALCFSSIDLRKLIEDAVQNLVPYTGEKRIQLRLQLHDVPAATGDAEKLTRAIYEIIRNAIQYSRPEDVVTVSLNYTGEQIVIRVQDAGIGLAQKEIDLIFNRLYRVDRTQKNRGTGLGLSIAKLIIEAHHGTIAVESAPNQGSTFRIHLPITRQPD
jgi:PAS domain S-box-containing protein